MTDCLIVGGGVIGLSLAYELAGQGLTVRLLDASQPGREASWAGAGILPPASALSDDPLERLTALSNELHTRWAAELASATGIDNGLRATGAIYLEREPDAAAQLDLVARRLNDCGITASRVTLAELRKLEPIIDARTEISTAYLLPDERQIRNPRHLKALVAGCLQRGVEIVGEAKAEDFELASGRIRRVHTPAGAFAGDKVCITTGSWTGALAAKLGVAAAIKPIRGQMLLLATRKRVLGRIINEGPRYLVPRDDGRVLVGSTEEDAGFDRSTTAEAISGLLAFALSLAPQLADAQVERCWAGLRPATRDGLPYLGRVPQLDNGWIAAGHFRGGLQQSTGTAVVMSQLMLGLAPSLELEAFRLDRDVAPTKKKPHRARPEVSLLDQGPL